jgi:ADP-ribose pyrophosphatase YjhB (NUDIX family)
MNQIHPRANDKGQTVIIASPNQPTPLSHWTNPDLVASVVPGGALPQSLNGIPFASWTDAPAMDAGWELLVQNGGGDFTEPPLKPQPGKPAASGVVILEPDGRVWVVSPTNRFGCYVNTFPKGKLDLGLSLRGNALKEAFEESGLKVELTGFLCDSVRSTSVTRFYTARRLGGHPGDMGWESQAVHLVPKEILATCVNHQNDQAVVQVVLALDGRD